MEKWIISLLLCTTILCNLLSQGVAAASASTGDGLCEHHKSHIAECGYSEGTKGSPCTHVHTEDCYILFGGQRYPAQCGRD